MKFTKLVAAAALATAAVPATLMAQNAVELTVGATVYGPQGGEVGTIESLADETVTVNTGNHSAALPANAFGSGENGPVIGFTKEQLDAAIEAASQAASDQARQEQEALMAAAWVEGASVRSSDGVVVGTVETIKEDGGAVLRTETAPVNLEQDHFMADDQGLVLHMTAQQLADALSAAVG